MTTLSGRPRLAPRWLLLAVFIQLLSIAAAVHMIKTARSSTGEVFLPDGRAMYLHFKVEEPADKEEKEVKGKQDKDDNPALGGEDGEWELDEDVENEEEPELDGGRKQRSASPKVLSVTYLVYPFMYPALNFTVAQRNVWYQVHFYHDRVYIPAANLTRAQNPPSWWGRKAIVSSEPAVLWRLCYAPDDCDTPPQDLKNTTTSGTSMGNPGEDRLLVIVFVVMCMMLMFLCLVLLAMVLRLRKRLLQRRPKIASADTIVAD